MSTLKALNKLVFFILILTLVACYPNNSEGVAEVASSTIPTVPIIPTDYPRPEFVLRVSPEEQQILPLTLFEADLTDEYFVGTGDVSVPSWGDMTTGYRKQICIEMELGNLAEVGDDFTQRGSITERVEMDVDGVSLSKIGAGHTSLTATHVYNSKGEVLILGIGSAIACGTAQLNTGVHEVVFRFHRSSGDIEEYIWHFALIGDS